MKKLLSRTTLALVALVLLLGSNAFSESSNPYKKYIKAPDGSLMTQVIGPSYNGDVGTFAISSINPQSNSFYVLDTTTGAVRFCRMAQWDTVKQIYQLKPRCGPWSGDAMSWYE